MLKTKQLKPLNKTQKIKHIEKDNRAFYLMTLAQNQITTLRQNTLGASSSPTAFLKGEGCFNPLWEFFKTFSNQMNREISDEMAGNFYRGTVLEKEIAIVFEHGERINYKFDELGRCIYYEIQNKTLADRVKNKQKSCVIHNYEKTLSRNIDEGNSNCTISATLDRLIIEDDLSKTVLYPQDYPYLKEARYALGAVEIKSSEMKTFQGEDGRYYPIIDLKNKNNVKLQYLIQCQNQMWQCDLDYVDLIHSSLSTHIVHRIYRDAEFMKVAHKCYIEFWTDAMIAREKVEKVKQLELIINDTVTFDGLNLDEKTVLTNGLFFIHQELEKLNSKYLNKEFLSDSQYKDYLSMVYTGNDLQDMSEYIKSGEIKDLEELELLKTRESDIITLIEKKKELDYSVKALASVTNDIKFKMGSFTSVTGLCDLYDKDGNIVLNKDGEVIKEFKKLCTYNSTEKGSRILKVK